jgi:hypothetical protein
MGSVFALREQQLGGTFLLDGSAMPDCDGISELHSVIDHHLGFCEVGKWVLESG